MSPTQDALIREAASAENTTVPAFMLDPITAQAVAVLEQQREITLSNAAFDQFIAELDKPAAPVPELVRLFGKHAKLPEA